MIRGVDLDFPTFEDLKRNRTSPAKARERKVTKVNAVGSAGTLRTACYVRVSTEHADQDGSWAIQQEHFETYLESHPECTLVGIYAERISGTHMENRQQLNLLLEECRNHRVDLVLTKSISRMARNTTDLLEIVRELRAYGTGIVFEKENIRTMDKSGELFLTIMSSIAQQESESISKNVQLGVRYHFQEGRVCGGHQNILGYKRTKEGKLEIIPEEAKIVRRIFRLFLDGFSPRHISEMMQEERVRDGKERKWDQSSIRYILTNPKYCGDLILQRYYTVDVFEKKVAENKGQVPQYFVENSHDPVVPKEVFYRVQGELARRSKARERYQKDTGLGGKVVCGDCGNPFIRRKEAGIAHYRCITKTLGKGTERYRRLYAGTECKSGGIREDRLQELVVQALNETVVEKEELLRLQERINWGPLKQADRMIRELQAAIKEQQAATEEEDISELEERLAAAVEKKAEFWNREMQIRNLLDRIGALSNPEEETNPDDSEPACSDPEDFYRRTRRHYEPGPVKSFSTEEAILFIDRIIVGEKVMV